MEDGTQQGSGIHPSIPKSSQMYTQLLCTSPHKGASTTILDYTDSPPSQKKTSPALPISPGRIPSPTPNYKNTLPAYPQHVPSSSSTPNTNLHLLIPPHKLYPRPIPPPHKKNYESQDNNTTTTNKRLGFREIVLATTRLQLPWLRTSWE
jgi:hypothetical protein